MPELPDIEAYRTALQRTAVGQPLQRVRLSSPFLLRSVDPPLGEFEGRTLSEVRRIGKRLAFGFDDDLWWVLHLMIAGRLRWREPDVKLSRRTALAAFDFPDGSLLLTEAGTKKRASLYAVRGEAGLAEHDPGGLDPRDLSPEEFQRRLTSENHTLKRALTDPRIFAGIGNAYSDEILHTARLSPIAWTTRLAEDEVERLRIATVDTLDRWTRRLCAEAEQAFPDKVTAFRPEMAVHGRYGEPCPACSTPVQRIRYAANETNYCPACQTGGKVLADRSLSRLLGKDWPRSIEELERLRGAT